MLVSSGVCSSSCGGFLLPLPAAFLTAWLHIPLQKPAAQHTCCMPLTLSHLYYFQASCCCPQGCVVNDRFVAWWLLMMGMNLWVVVVGGCWCLCCCPTCSAHISNTRTPASSDLRIRWAYDALQFLVVVLSVVTVWVEVGGGRVQKFMKLPPIFSDLSMACLHCNSIQIHMQLTYTYAQQMIRVAYKLHKSFSKQIVASSGWSNRRKEYKEALKNGTLN